jgi:hypothetical protein
MIVRDEDPSSQLGACSLIRDRPPDGRHSEGLFARLYGPVTVANSRK